GTDTECDLVIAAASEAERRAVARIRDALLAEHCGADAEQAAALIARTGSIIAVADTLARNGHRLRPIDDGAPAASDLAASIEAMADPERPIEPEAFVQAILGGPARRRVPALLKIAVAALLVLALTLSWEFTPLSRFAAPEVVRETLTALTHGPW